MKKQSLLILMFLFSLGMKAQHCDFNYNFTGGVFNTVNFSPNSAFSPNIYHFNWNFGDGSTSTNSNPTHAYNSLPPYYVCYDILDTANVLVCSFCDSVSPVAPVNCNFTAIQSGTGMTAIFQTQAAAGTLVSWTVDSNITAIAGNPVTYTFFHPGTHNVCMLEIEIATGDTLCNVCRTITITSGSNTCSFTANSNPANLLSYNFGANVLAGSTVSWDFGDNTTGTGIQTTHLYNAPGTYNVCITVIEPNGAVCNYCHHVTVGVIHGNCFFTFAPTSGSNTFTFNGSSAWANNQLSWDFGDGTHGQGNVVTHTYVHTGNYIVCMTERDSAGAVVCSSCNNIVINPINNCNFTSSNNPLNPLTIDFQANNGNNSVVTWNFGDSTSATGVNVHHTYPHPGTYNVCITVASGGAITCTACRIVTVGNSVPCVINYYPDPAQINSYIFNFQPSAAASMIVWDFGDGTIDTGVSVNHHFAAPGAYQVCIIERDLLQNVLCQTCVAVIVNGGPANCQASFLSTTLGLTGYFIDLSITTSSQTSYSWDFGDGSTSTNHFPQHTYASAGTYNGCLTITSGNCVDQFCSPVTVDTLFNPGGGGCQAFYTILQLAPYEVTVVNLSSGLNLNFLWDFGDGSTDTQAYPSHFYTATGSYNLCLTVSDANGCSSTFCDTLNVDSLGNLTRFQAGFSINIISPSALTGVNEIKTNKSFRAYPNPTNSDLHLSIMSGSEKATGYRILSLQGSEVLRGTMNGFEGQINLEKLTAGTYLLEVSLSDGSRSYQAVIKN